MNIIDFWFLDSVSEHKLPPFALRLPNIGEMLNRHDHGLSGAEVAGRFRALLDQGLIAVFSRESGEPVPPPGDSELEEMLNPPPPEGGFRPSFAEAEFLYGLTETGAARWEKRVGADWARFTTISRRIDPDECEVAASSEARLVEAIGFTGAVWDGYCWDPREIRFTRMEPWRPVYWKELPLGWRATYPLKRMPAAVQYPGCADRCDALERYWQFAHWKTRCEGSRLPVAIR